MIPVIGCIEILITSDAANAPMIHQLQAEVTVYNLICITQYNFKKNLHI